VDQAVFDRAEVGGVYARLTLHTADPARLSEVISHYEHDVRMDLTHQPGSRGMSVLVNDDLGVAVVAAYWATEDAMRANDASFVRPVHDAAFFGATVSIEHYECARFVHVAPARPGAAVSLTRLDIEATGLDDVLAAYGDAAGPLSGSDGFCTAVLLVDRQGGRAVVETMWRDGEALVAARGPAAARRLEAVKGGNVTVRGVDQYRLDFHSVELE
jgi:heme-degrading monooxygenase HmoA